jgi:hypothetical protein
MFRYGFRLCSSDLLSPALTCSNDGELNFWCNLITPCGIESVVKLINGGAETLFVIVGVFPFQASFLRYHYIFSKCRPKFTDNSLRRFISCGQFRSQCLILVHLLSSLLSLFLLPIVSPIFLTTHFPPKYTD